MTPASSARRAAAERPARRGDDEALQRVARLGPQALLQRRVLGVDRQEAPAAAPQRVEHQRAAGDEALLVREREVRPALQRREAGLQPGGADDRVEHDVGPCRPHELGRTLRPLVHVALEDRARPRGGGRVAERDVLRPVRVRGRHERLVLAARGQRDDLEAGVAGGDVECLGTDGAGSPEDRDALHGTSS